MEDKKEWVEPEETTVAFDKIKKFVDDSGAKYDLSEHKAVKTSEEAAEVRGVSLDTGAKAMLLKDTGKKLALEGVPFYLAVLSASKRFSSKQFKKIISCKSVRFATPEEVYSVTGCLTGAVPPFGKVFNLPVWVDRSLSKQPSINFNCGLRTKSMSMSYDDYFKIEEPKWHVFTEEEVELGDLPVEEKTEKVDSREAKKAERLAKRQNKVKEQGADDGKKDPNDPAAHLFGERELNRSQGDPELRHSKKFTDIKTVDKELDGQEVILRARLHNSRGKGKLCFIVLRQQFSSVQCILAQDEVISKGMVNYASKIPKESIVEIKGKVTVPENPIETCTQKVEIQVQEFWVIDKSAPILPFQIDDASRLVTDQAAEEGGATGEEAKEGEGKGAVVKQDIRLNNRIIDLRVPTNQAIFRLQAGVCALFREFLMSQGFIEIHSPKMIGGASEGGSNVFKFKYFGQDACLAQSPQLYKQMALCSDFDRVFEIGPVFRAEDSNTNRHLCEFTGLDMEMTIKEHYFEVLDMLANMLVFIFEGLATRYRPEIEKVKEQYPFEDFKCKTPVVKLHFKEGVKILAEAGYNQGALEDLSTENEKALGRLVKEKYDTDFYMLYGYPAAVRPFYTMLDPTDPNYTNSYDFFMRGEEITSGA
mmetsp:Transcript_34682/g.53156  ORF Transcript_34682/g.53156 Transcript_34682/m.53156 type:complete len:647 (-) Transcript_34682:292-2232(-)